MFFFREADIYFIIQKTLHLSSFYHETRAKNKKTLENGGLLENFFVILRRRRFGG